MMNKDMKPEFSYFVNRDEIPSKEKHHKLKASDEQCLSLAKRFDLKELSDFGAHLVIKDEGRRKGVKLIGKLFAKAIKVSETSDNEQVIDVNDDINIRFLPEEAITPELEEENLMTLDSEDLEPLPVDRIDLGELMSQYLALNIEPLIFDVSGISNQELGEGITLNEPELKRENPFAVLSGLKEKLQQDDQK